MIKNSPEHLAACNELAMARFRARMSGQDKVLAGLNAIQSDDMAAMAGFAKALSRATDNSATLADTHRTTLVDTADGTPGNI